MAKDSINEVSQLTADLKKQGYFPADSGAVAIRVSEESFHISNYFASEDELIQEGNWQWVKDQGFEY